MTEASTSGPFRPLTISDLFAFEVPEIEYAVEGILPQGSACLLSGREKSGKGLITLDLCASIALGEPFLGCDVLQGPAIYCAAEEHVRDVRSRVEARIGDNRDAPLYVLPLDGSTGDRLRLDEPESMQRLWDMVAEMEPVVVVLDPFRELHECREDDADEMAPLLRPVRQLAHQTNTAVMVNHHQNRGGTFRGSTAIRAAFDLEWEFRRTDEDAARDGDPPRGRIKVEGRHGPRKIVHVRLGEGLRWETAEPSSTTQDPSTRDRILNHLVTCATYLTAPEIAAAIGAADRTVQNLLAAMSRETMSPLDVQGPGTRNEPRRYGIPTQALAWHSAEVARN